MTTAEAIARRRRRTAKTCALLMIMASGFVMAMASNELIGLGMLIVSLVLYLA